MKKRKSSFAAKTRPAGANERPNHIVHHFDKYVTLIEDTFGMLFDGDGKSILVKRFTWTNHNKISVSVITYGARITSMKVPDRGANIEELVFGFDDLAGYLFYDKYAFGATIGRTTTKLYKSTFVVDGKQHWVHANDGEHHKRGGLHGFDKVNWTPYVNGNVLQLSYLSKDGEEGYPGDLHVRITFELTTAAEFRICIKANTSKTTPVDISNNTYFNLAGHQAGEEEMRQHELLINANCYTEMDEENQFPTGKIFNVVHTKFDFQVPKLVGDVMGPPGADMDYDQNFCINRGVTQEDAFMARLVHPFKGRVLEIYSNQYGLNFTNAYDLPGGHLQIPVDLMSLNLSVTSQQIREHESVFIVIKKIAQYFKDNMDMEPEQYHAFIKNLVRKLLADKIENESQTSLSSELEFIGGYKSQTYQDFDPLMVLRPLELQFLYAIRELLPYVTEDMPFEVVKDAIDEILQKHGELDIDPNNLENTNSFIQKLFANQAQTIESSKATKNEKEVTVEVADKSEETLVTERKSVMRRIKEEKEAREKKVMRCGVPMPGHYKSDRITGRGGVIYRRYGGFALRSQCYPNAMLMENFPKPVLHPHETYTHTITYKFWILAGDPEKWLRRLELAHPCDANY